MKKILATLTVLIVFGALVWHQLPTDEDIVVIEDIVEVEEPILPPSNAFPEIDLDRHIVRPFDEQFALDEDGDRLREASANQTLDIDVYRGNDWPRNGSLHS